MPHLLFDCCFNVIILIAIFLLLFQVSIEIAIPMTRFVRFGSMLCEADQTIFTYPFLFPFLILKSCLDEDHQSAEEFSHWKDRGKNMVRLFEINNCCKDSAAHRSKAYQNNVHTHARH
jgi:hypothetical protein